MWPLCTCTECAALNDACRHQISDHGYNGDPHAAQQRRIQCRSGDITHAGQAHCGTCQA